MQVSPYPLMEQARGHGALGEPQGPELQGAGIGWPSLIPPDVMLYNQVQQPKFGELPPSVAPAAVPTPPRSVPWHYSGITDGGILVNKFKYLAASDPSDAGDIQTKHVHEHHHYDYASYKNRNVEVNQVQSRPTRLGYLLIRDMVADNNEPPRPNPNRYETNMFHLRNNRRFLDNRSFFYPQLAPCVNCPFYGTPNSSYGQNPRFPLSNAAIPGHHHHVHQHFYHQFHPSLNYQPSLTRFLQPQQSRFPYNQHFHQHNRPYIPTESPIWSDPPGNSVIRLY